MEKFKNTESAPAESPLVRMQERMEDADITNKEDFWKLVIDLSVDYPDYTRSQIAESLMNRIGSLPEEVVDAIDTERVEMNKFDLVVQDLNQMPLENESDYNKMLKHLTHSRGLSEDMVRSAILQECRIDPDLRDVIESEGVSTPGAFISNLDAREIDRHKIASEPEMEKQSISEKVIDAVRERLDSEDYARELEALEGITAAVTEGRDIYETEAKEAGKEGYTFVREVLARMDNLNMTEYPDLVEKISVAVSTEVEQGRDAEGLRNIQFDPNDKVLNIAALYVAIALHRKMSS